MLYLLIILTLLPPTNVRTFDHPNDAGSAVSITWKLSQDDSLVDNYVVLRRTLPDTSFEKIGSAMHGITFFEDDKTDDKKEYVYVIAAAKDGELFFSEPSNWVRSFPQIFHAGRINVLISILVFTLLLIFFVARAKTGKHLFIRRIQGLAAVDEAVGRATEMGKPILYVPGLGDIDYASTIASMNILGEIAKKIARYDTPLIVANRWSVTYTVAKEIVKEAFVSEGRPDKFKEDYVRYLTEDQFGFAAAVDGIMLREKPATNFLWATL